MVHAMDELLEDVLDTITICNGTAHACLVLVAGLSPDHQEFYHTHCMQLADNLLRV